MMNTWDLGELMEDGYIWNIQRNHIESSQGSIWLVILSICDDETNAEAR